MVDGSEFKDGALSPELSHELNVLQEEAADDVLDYLEGRAPNDPFPLVAMATGIGKGRIIHKIIEKKIRKKPDAKILVIAGTKLTLIDQTHEALQNYLYEDNGKEHNWIDSESDDQINELTSDISEEEFEKSYLYSTVDYKNRKESTANVHIATIQTIQSDKANNRLNPNDYDLVIVDEVHNVGTRARVDAIQRFNNAVGFTATAHRHSGDFKNPEQYGFTIIKSLTLPEAQEKNFLPPLVESAIPTDHLVDTIPTKVDGTIDYKKLEKLLKESPDLRPFIADKIHEFIIDGEKQKKAVIAVNFVWEAQELANLLSAKGIKVGVAVNQVAARRIDSKEIPALDSIRRYKLHSTDPESLQVLISPYVASEGFDAPQTEVLAWASPTDSTVRYTQFTGRLARRAPGKQYGHVVDFLYQTSQFKWSYNFGQWMKDSVVQLADGRLFQGSKRQLDQLQENTDFTQIKTSRNEIKIPLKKLQEKTALDAATEDEFVINQTTIQAVFSGGYDKVFPIAQETLRIIQDDQPDLIRRRRSGTRTVIAVGDRNRFIELMILHGASLKRDLSEPAEGEFVINRTSLKNSFMGNDKRLSEIANEVVSEIRRNNPDLILQRRKFSQTVTVVADSDLFLKMMKSRGVKTKPERFQEGDFEITRESMIQLFIGDYEDKLNKLVKEVIEEIHSEHPELVVQRLRSTRFVTVVLDKDLFIEKMLKRGVKQKEDLQVPQHDEILVSTHALGALFKGHPRRIRPIAHKVLAEIERDRPEFVVERKNGAHIVKAVTDKSLFIQMMVKAGLDLKD